MTTQDEKVDSLKKITILFEGGTTPDRMDLTASPVEHAFIFGAGLEGITPFEYELANKSPGDEVVVRASQTDLLSRFEHLASFIMEHIEPRETFYIKARIIAVTTPEDREVVKALAESATHGGGCDCGCGCS